MILDGHKPVSKIAALIPCIYSPTNTTQSLPSIEIRGKAFEILLALVGRNEEIWDALETYHALPLKSNSKLQMSSSHESNRASAAWRCTRRS